MDYNGRVLISYIFQGDYKYSTVLMENASLLESDVSQ